MSRQQEVLTLTEICIELQLSQDACVELVDLGVVSPSGNAPQDWTFDYTSVCIIRRAARLRRELDLEWSAVAVAVNLLEERERMQAETETLRQRLDRFLGQD